MVFYNLEPFGAEARSFGHAITSSVVANVHRGKNKKAFSPKDFMPKHERKKVQTPTDMIGIAAVITTAFGGKDKRKKE